MEITRGCIDCVRGFVDRAVVLCMMLGKVWTSTMAFLDDIGLFEGG